MYLIFMRMAQHSRSYLLYFLFFVYMVDLINGTHVSKNMGNILFRHRRSYEQRHKGKEAIMNNVVKTSANSNKPGLFATENCTVVVAQIGGTATLPCVVRKFNNGVVSWMRKQDYHLLTVGLTTYNTDDRFMVEHVRHLQNWGLLIKKVQPSDAGLYECQMSTHPPTSIVVELRVTSLILRECDTDSVRFIVLRRLPIDTIRAAVKHKRQSGEGYTYICKRNTESDVDALKFAKLTPFSSGNLTYWTELGECEDKRKFDERTRFNQTKIPFLNKALAEIQGAPDLHLRAGSLLRLVCTLRDSTEPPAFVFWYHEQRMINYDPGVSVKEGRSSSILQLQEADKSHNGNYTCSPSNAAPASINVHVLNATAEEKPAAMQHANSSSSPSSFHIMKCGVFIVIIIPLLSST